MGTKTRQITLREWFPADDPIAAAVATLCILREDYFIDLMGIVKGRKNRKGIGSPC